MTSRVETVIYHTCNVCNEHEFSFHPKIHSAGGYTWVCNCGAESELIFSFGASLCYQKPTGRRCERTLCLVRVVSAPHILAIHKAVEWDDNLQGTDDYYYAEHTCPVNIMECEEIIISGVPDPHGMFELVEKRYITGPKAIKEDVALYELTNIAMELSTTK